MKTRCPRPLDDRDARVTISCLGYKIQLFLKKANFKLKKISFFMCFRAPESATANGKAYSRAVDQ